jgi:ABC-type nitrate/sulfonate/bicarbonate transport system substrate-binding protein
MKSALSRAGNRTRPMFRREFAVGAVAAGLTLAIAACGSSGSDNPSSSTDALTSVSFTGNPSSGIVDEWIASKEGFFKQQGLNVKVDLAINVSATVELDEFLSGKYQFVSTTSSFGINSIAADPNAAKVIGSAQSDQTFQIAVQPELAKRLHMPSASNNLQQVIAQLKVFKGQKNIMTGTSNGLVNVNNICMLSELKALGITEGANDSNATFNIQTTGTLAAGLAAFKAGKLDTIVSIPPYTIAGRTWPVIQIGYLPGCRIIDDTLLATPSMIKDHPETVQKFMNAVVEANQWVKTHETAAENLLRPLAAAAGYTNASDQKIFLPLMVTSDPTPMVTAPYFSRTLDVANGGQLANGNQKDDVTYASAVDNSFVNKAFATFGVKPPAPDY